MSTIDTRSRSLEPGPLITLYDLNLSIYGGPIYYFHDGVDPASATDVLAWNGQNYNPYPIKAEEFEWNTRGVLPRPKLSVSNIGSVVSALLRQYHDFVGCSLTRTRTFAAFIGGGAEQDYSKKFPIDRFIIERKSVETNTIVSFELSMHLDAEGVQLPRRQIIANTCPWIYRSPECSYAGVPKQATDGTVFGAGVDRGTWNSGTTYASWDYVHTVLPSGLLVYYVSHFNGNLNHPVTDTVWWWTDACLKKVTDCKLHFGADTPLPYGGFPACWKIT